MRCVRGGLLATMIVFLVLSASAFGEQEGRVEETWDAHIAKQLVAPGWENAISPIEEPVAVYLLRLVELDLDLSRLFAARGHYAGEGDSGHLWRVLTEDEYGAIMAGLPSGLSLELEGYLEHIQSQSRVDSWLVTVGHERVWSRLEEEYINSSSEKTSDVAVEISLTPLKIDAESERVLTSIDLRLKGARGTEAGSGTVSWISSTCKRPLAVISHRVQSAEHIQEEYFGMYVVTGVLAPDDLPKAAPLIAAGNVTGLQLLMSAEEQDHGRYENRNEFLVQVEGGDGGTGIKKEVFRTIEGIRGYASIANTPLGCSYTVGVDYPLQDELRLSARIEQKLVPRDVATARLGLSDHTSIGVFDLESTYLPLTLDLQTWKVSYSSHIQLTIRLHRKGWHAWYECLLTQGQLIGSLGVNRMFTGGYGVQTVWTRTAGGCDRISLGLIKR